MSKAFVKESDDEADLPDEPAAVPLGFKNYMTPRGHRHMQDELRQLLRVERPKVVETVAWAAGNGDRSENGDYIYGKRRLREIDRRIRFLTKRLESAEVVDPKQQKRRDQVFFGATVTYAAEDGTETTITIVGIDEADFARGQVSWISPIARALMKAHELDIVEFRREFDRRNGKVTGRYDASVRGYDPFPDSSFFRFGDQSGDALAAPVTSAAVDLTTRKLNWRPDGSYELGNGAVEKAWDFGRGLRPAESVTELRQVLALDPKLKVLVAHGLFDLATPYFGSKMLLDQLPTFAEAPRVKLVVYIGASVLTGLAVSVSGAIGYVGLLVPHVMRMMFGTDYRLLIPASALGGAIAIVIADTLARTVVAPTELPVGAMTALAGAPVFIYLMRRKVR